MSKKETQVTTGNGKYNNGYRMTLVSRQNLELTTESKCRGSISRM